MSSEQILRKVWEGDIECTVVDDNIFAVNRRYFPGLQVAFPISEQQQLAWIVKDENDELKEYINHWIEEFENEYQLPLLRDKYYSHVTKYDFVDLRAYHKRINTRLPKYKSIFKRAGEKYGIPWTLLAAQAYQESHWYKYAKSPTGVRGIMMLTRRTARSLGVTNRIDPTQSIMGGAKYLKRLERIVPDNFREEDETNYMLAAYNVGMGHMRDARTLAKRLNKDPNIWRDLREVLPLLSNPKYYRNLKYGYARGTEPVRYVDRILNYRSILEQKDIEVTSR
jgi:membrane-bound lytic murein transglycosylase F